jgi:hypothetical protein
VYYVSIHINQHSGVGYKCVVDRVSLVGIIGTAVSTEEERKNTGKNDFAVH